MLFYDQRKHGTLKPKFVSLKNLRPVHANVFSNKN